MEKNSYQKLEDFILTESFRDYVLGTDLEAVIFWNQWIIDNPGQKNEFEHAKMILEVLLNPRKQTVPFKKEAALKDLLEKIENSDNRFRRQKTRFSHSIWLKAVAVLVVLFSVSIVWKYLLRPKPQIETAEYQIIVPIGEKSQVILPDGTHVWINSGSRFVYPANYGANSRKVYLEGEAYFDVTKKQGMPFVVNTKDVNIKVLGTAFNVKEYATDKTVETTVVRGLVRVESVLDQHNSIYVNPNEKAVYLKQNQHIAIAGQSVPKSVVKNREMATEPILVVKANPEPITCWKDQLLVFTDETFEDMVVKMERWYNIKINIINPKLKQERFNGKFVHNETVYQVLEAIKLTTPIEYSVENNEINITQK